MTSKKLSNPSTSLGDIYAPTNEELVAIGNSVFVLNE